MVSGDADEKALVESAQRDPRRFAELYARHVDRVYAFVARRVPARSDAQDLTSEVFQHALANLERFEWRGVPFAAWLYRIAANAVADHYQRRAREQGAALDDAGGEDADALAVERRALIYRAVRTLPDDQRRVIELRFAGERSIAEIAQALGRSEGAVKQLQLRAMQSLRRRLDEADA
jgi:RNA polymerase sigma-70 factor (ECF subfamily)